VTNWYDLVYGNDPSTDNIFGREALVPARDPLLHLYLAEGGRLSQFAWQKPLPLRALPLHLVFLLGYCRFRAAHETE
jgi:hypothetical protein